jgi:soluble lytic murein transglycosylase|tara:strand:- start:50 stop:2272 length:2223 start_codon:yes stop_codon:yes gene_type:complete
MKKNLFLLTILFSFLATTYVSSQENVIIPLKKPTLNPELKEKKISINIIKPLEKPILVKEVKKKDEKEEIVENKKITKLGIIVPKNKPKIVQKTIEKVAKKSKYFSKKEFELAAKAINAMQKGNWPNALSLAKKTRNNDIYSFIQWRHLLTNRNNASYYDYQQFIDKNPDYPRIGRIKYLSEHKLSTEKVSPKKIIKKFSEEEPLSGFGEMILGESYIINGESAKGINLIKKGFEKAELSKSDLRFFRKKYKKYLNSEDYIKRAKYLAWENKYWDLKRMLRYLPKEEQLLYTARQLLMSKSYGVDNAIAKVPDRLKNDSGLNYDRLKWRRKRGRVDSSLEILLKVPNNKIYLVRPEKWWKEREIIGRSLIYKKKYELAYKVVSKHSMVEGPEYAAAEWMSGWIALSFLNDPILAVEHFDNFYNNVGYPISLARGAYWLGRSYEKMGSKDLQNKWYQEASKYLTTYYGQLAFLKINPEKTFELDLEQVVDKDYKKKFENKGLVKVIYLLNELNKDKYTKHMLRHLALDDIEKGSEILAAELATNISRYDFAIQIAKIASYEKRFLNNYNYPIIGTPKIINGRKIPETPFILSIIRQESEFDMKANSSAGARGLMQLMTYTAKLVAKQAKLPYSKSRLTTDPEYNINLGSHYIAGLILEYDGSYPFAIAAYNAGPKRVKYWKRLNKNPQKNQIDYVDWIELIKFKETRNYVQRVLENYNVYRFVVEKRPIKMLNFFKDMPLY